MSTSTKNPQIPQMLQGVTRIVTMGDSITDGGRAPKGYVTLVDQAIKAAYPANPIEFINVGIGGQKAPDMHARFKKDVIDKHPQLVTISVGVNDVWHDFRDPAWTKRVPTGDSGRGIKLDLHISELQAMVTEAKDAGIKVVIVSPTLIYEDLTCDENKRLDQYVNAQRKLARDNKVPFVDLNKSFKTVVSSYQKLAGRTQLLLTTDGVHMNDQGNALMAGEILKSLGVPIPEKVSP